MEWTLDFNCPETRKLVTELVGYLFWQSEGLTSEQKFFNFENSPFYIWHIRSTSALGIWRNWEIKSKPLKFYILTLKKKETIRKIFKNN